MNGIRDLCHHLASRASGNCSGGVSRDSAASSDDVRDTRSRARLRLTPNGCVHTKPGESTSVREPTGAGIRRKELAEQLDNDNRPGHEGFRMREVCVGVGAWLTLVLPSTERRSDSNRLIATTEHIDTVREQLMRLPRGRYTDGAGYLARQPTYFTI